MKHLHPSTLQRSLAMIGATLLAGTVLAGSPNPGADDMSALEGKQMAECDKPAYDHNREFCKVYMRNRIAESKRPDRKEREQARLDDQARREEQVRQQNMRSAPAFERDNPLYRQRELALRDQEVKRMQQDDQQLQDAQRARQRTPCGGGQTDSAYSCSSRPLER